MKHHVALAAEEKESKKRVVNKLEPRIIVFQLQRFWLPKPILSQPRADRFACTIFQPRPPFSTSNPVPIQSSLSRLPLLESELLSLSELESESRFPK
jgi:hypothetical protein